MLNERCRLHHHHHRLAKDVVKRATGMHRDFVNADLVGVDFGDHIMITKHRHDHPRTLMSLDEWRAEIKKWDISPTKALLVSFRKD